MTAALLYQPRHKWRIGLAFGAAALIHFAAIAFANVHRTEKQGSPFFTDQFTDITFVEPPSTPIDPDPDTLDPMPTPRQDDAIFPEERSTPPPTRRQIKKAIAPLVKPSNNGPAAPLTWSYAKVLAVSAPRPEYPYEARRQKLMGNGVAMMVVDPVSGAVRDVIMSESTGSLVLDNATVAALRRWRFKSGTASQVKVPITFTMTGAMY
jgi:TonB family protein